MFDGHAAPAPRRPTAKTPGRGTGCGQEGTAPPNDRKLESGALAGHGVSIRSTGIREVEYTPGQIADVYGTENPRAATVLLWHGSGANERSALAGLAARLSIHAAVVVPDWRADSHAARADLLASLELAYSLGGPLIAAGWSLGATAAVSLAWEPHVRVDAIVGLAGDYASPSPITGSAPLDLALVEPRPTPVWLFHGEADRIVLPASSEELMARLEEHGTAATLQKVPTDHAGIVLARYDDDTGRCLPLSTPPIGTDEVLRGFALAIAAATQPGP